MPEGDRARRSVGVREDGGAMHTVRRRLLVISVVAAVAGCAGATPSSPSLSASPSASASPSPSPVATPAASAAPSGAPINEAAFRAALESATAELIAAIGNPDTGSSSDASVALDAALKSGDAAAISSTAAVVLGHLAAGRASVADVAEYRPGAEMSAEWDRLLAGTAAGIAAMRDGGLAEDPAAVDAGRTRMLEAQMDHFWPAVRGPSPDLTRIDLPDGRTATASRMRLSTPVANAFDGSTTSAWTAGDALAPQWIEIDLGWEATIAGVRLLMFQDVPGATEHLVTVRGATGPERELIGFSASTTDGQWLEYTAPTPVSDVQVVRVTTLATPSMIGWREIEVVLAPGSHASPCPVGSANLAIGSATVAPLALPGHPAAFAVDGRPETYWDSGPGASPGIIVDLGREMFVSEVRLLAVQTLDGVTRVEVTGTGDGGYRMLGDLEGTTADGQWLSVPGPAPCISLRRVFVNILSPSSTAAWREIQVLGTVAP